MRSKGEREFSAMVGGIIVCYEDQRALHDGGFSHHLWALCEWVWPGIKWSLNSTNGIAVFIVAIENGCTCLVGQSFGNVGILNNKIYFILDSK